MHYYSELFLKLFLRNENSMYYHGEFFFFLNEHDGNSVQHVAVN